MWKKSIAGLMMVSVTLASTPAQAEEFDTLLQSSLTPAEVAIHQQRGNTRALQLARNACTQLDAGTSIQAFAAQVSQSLAKEGLPREKLETTALYTGKVIAVGIASFCPQHLSQLQELQP